MRLSFKINSEERGWSREVSLDVFKPVHRKIWNEVNEILDKYLPEAESTSSHKCHEGSATGVECDPCFNKVDQVEEDPTICRSAKFEKYGQYFELNSVGMYDEDGRWQQMEAWGNELGSDLKPLGNGSFRAFGDFDLMVQEQVLGGARLIEETPEPQKKSGAV